MPHAVEYTQPKASGRAVLRLQQSYEESRILLQQSSLFDSIPTLLPYKDSQPIKNIVSLGLGTFTTKNQSRVMKQLAFLLAIWEQFDATSETGPVRIYAQDPTFTRTDEVFLKSVGIMVVHTPSSSELGEAGQIIDRSTLVYSPFLPIDTYELLFRTCAVDYLVGDDFNALRAKWPKHTAERSGVELLMKGSVSKLRRKAIGTVADTFWTAEDKPSPMAVYWRQFYGVELSEPFANASRSRKILEKL